MKQYLGNEKRLRGFFFHFRKLLGSEWEMLLFKQANDFELFHILTFKLICQAH